MTQYFPARTKPGHKKFVQLKKKKTAADAGLIFVNAPACLGAFQPLHT